MGLRTGYAMNLQNRAQNECLDLTLKIDFLDPQAMCAQGYDSNDWLVTARHSLSSKSYLLGRNAAFMLQRQQTFRSSPYPCNIYKTKRFTDSLVFILPH